jgi:hypothetical protein
MSPAPTNTTEAGGGGVLGFGVGFGVTRGVGRGVGGGVAGAFVLAGTAVGGGSVAGATVGGTADGVTTGRLGPRELVAGESDAIGVTAMLPKAERLAEGAVLGPGARGRSAAIATTATSARPAPRATTVARELRSGVRRPPS